MDHTINSIRIYLEMVITLSKGLKRALTEQEVRIIYWLGDCDYETRGVILDLFKELGEKIED
ncbi:hypothetical protein [Neobacillus mesonae]|uniref:hypothetical protein n=1 Tax=Neobacillus mesonae TaxID=1193713 RepID=UPI002573733C|nr:hypothetical protein [Neobacillus mesonae]